MGLQDYRHASFRTASVSPADHTAGLLRGRSEARVAWRGRGHSSRPTTRQSRVWFLLDGGQYRPGLGGRRHPTVERKAWCLPDWIEEGSNHIREGAIKADCLQAKDFSYETRVPRRRFYSRQADDDSRSPCSPISAAPRPAAVSFQRYLPLALPIPDR